MRDALRTASLGPGAAIPHAVAIAMRPRGGPARREGTAVTDQRQRRR